MNLTKYEHIFNGKKYVLYPGKNPKYLIITFSCVGANYNRVKQFWNNESWNEYSYLFLCEPESTRVLSAQSIEDQISTPWYTDQCDLVDHVMKDFERKNVITLGYSLGSFAALYHGVRAKVGIVLYTAPASPGFSYLHEFDGLKKYTELKSMLVEATEVPDLYIEGSLAIPDRHLMEEIISIFLTKKSKVVFETANHKNHTSVSLGDRSHVYRTIDYFLSWRNEPINYDWLNNPVER